MFQLTRPAIGRAWSDRTAKLGKPHDSLTSAFSAALKLSMVEGCITISSADAGLWATVSRVLCYTKRACCDRRPDRA